MGFIAYLVGLVADLISHNRQLVEMTLERVKTGRIWIDFKELRPTKIEFIDHPKVQQPKNSKS